MIVKDRGKVSLIEMSIHALRIIVSLYSLFTSAVDLESTAFVIIAVAIPQILSTLGKKDPNRLRAISIALASSSAQGYIPKIINIASILATIGLQKHQDQITSTITAAIVALIPPPLIYIFAAAHSLANSFVDETDRIVSIIKLADSTAKAVELEDEIEEPSKSQLIRVTKEIRNCSVSRNRASALLAIKKAVSLLPESQKHMGTLYQEMWREIRDLNHETTFQQMLRSITSIGITTSMTVLVAKNALGDSFPITCTNHSPVPPGPDPPNPKPKPTPDPVDEDEIEKEVAERVGDGEMVIKEGSNEHITDRIMSDEEMILDLDNRQEEGVSVVFATSIDGREPTSIKRLKRVLRRTPHVELSRATFNKAYKEAKELKQGVILTTDISECGANFEADRVYDFQATTKAIWMGNAIIHDKRIIDEGQRVQRRGRIGRRKPGEYISPGLTLREVDLDRAENYDRVIFAKTMDITIRDPIPGDDIETPLTKKQVKAWISTDEDSVESPWLIAMLTHPNGSRKSGRELAESLNDWANNHKCKVLVKDQEINCAFWDSRDGVRFQRMAIQMGKMTHELRDTAAAVNTVRGWAKNIKTYFDSKTSMDHQLKSDSNEKEEILTTLDEDRDE